MRVFTKWKVLGLWLGCMMLCCTLTARTYDTEPDSFDTVTVCRNELPILYDTTSIADSGDYLITLTSHGGTDSVVSVHVIVHENPEPHIAGDIFHCVNARANVYVENSYAHIHWSTGSENYYTSTSDSTCSVIVTDEAGCIGKDSISFLVIPLPEINAAGKKSICYGDTTVLHGEGGMFYYWYGHDGHRLSYEDSLIYVASTGSPYVETFSLRGYSEYGCVAQISIRVSVHPDYQVVDTITLCRNELPFHCQGNDYTEAGTYPIHFQSSCGCDSLVMTTLLIKEIPEVHILGVDSLCEGQLTAITATTYGTVSYHWSTQEEYVSIVAHPNHLYWLEGIGANGCTARDSIFVRSLPLPVVNIEGSRSICYGESTTLSASNGYTYLWSTGDTSSSITVGPAEQTDYQVIAHSQNTCSATASARVQVYPVYDTTIAVTCCSNELPYQYHDTSFTQSGTYIIRLSTAHGCDSIIYLNLTVLESPYANISGNPEICPGASTQLSANVNRTFRWSTGAEYSPITVNTAGTYVLAVTATNGCKSYDTVEVTYLPLPEISINGADSVCRGSEIQLVASGASSYSWNTGATYGSTLIATPLQSTTYIVTGTSDRNCIATATHYVKVNPLPTASISGADAVCQGNTADFIASGGTSYHWSTGDTSAILHPNIEQWYTVEVSNQFGCTSTSTKYLKVNELPSVSIVGINYFCEGGYTDLNAIGVGVISYVWNNVYFGQSYRVSNPGEYTVSALSSTGCTSTASITVTQQPNPVVTVSGDMSFCDGQSTQLHASGGQTYTWVNIYGAQIGNDSTISLNEGGTYSVFVTDTNGCTSVQQVVLTKKNLPSVSIVATDNEVCEGTPITLRADWWSSNYNYLWSTGATERQITINTAGMYRLQVTANGCSATDSIFITMYQLPVITFTGDTLICRGNSTIVYASAPNITDYQWTTGSAENYISVNPDVTTTYGVTVTDSHGCTNQNTVRITVEDMPVASILGPDSICVGESAVLQATGGLTYLWDNGATTADRIIHEAGTYSVVVYTAAGCYATASKTVYHYDIPEITISGNLNACVGDSVILTAHGGESYLWSNTTTDTSITVSTSGIYIVEGWNSHSCSSKDTVEVNLFPSPEVHITGNSSACPSAINTLTAQSPTAISYLWNTGSTTAQIRTTGSGTYTVSVRDTNSCQASASFTFELLPAPECSILGQSQICQGDTTTLTASNGEYFFWSNMATSQSIQVSPSATTTYTLVIRDANGCSASTSKQVVVKSYSSITINGENGFCDGDSVLLTAQGDGELVWSTGQSGDSIWVYETGDYTVQAQDSFACLLSSSKHIEKHTSPEVHIEGDSYLCYGETGTLHAVTNETVDYLWTTGSTDSVVNISSTNVYGVTVTNAYGCSNEAIQLVMVYSAPNVSINGPENVCNGEDVELTAIGNVTSYHWSTNDTTASIIVRPRFNTTYSVVAANSNGCTATAEWSLNVIPVPVVNITGDTMLCQGETSTLICSNASDFLWSTGATSRSISVSETGTYSVVATNSMGCTNSASIHVQVFGRPNLMILGDTVLCYGEQTDLLAIGGTSYLWSNGSTTPGITVAPDSSTTYTVQAFNGECMSEMSRIVVVNEKPTAAIIAPDGICEGSTVTMQAQGGIAYLWSTYQSASMIDVHASGNYQLVAFNQYGCSDTTSHYLIQYPTPQVYVTGSTALCQGEQGSLTAIGAGTFLWNTGDTSSSISINNPGFYQVQLTDSNGCVASANSNVTSLFAPAIVISGTNDMCEDDTVSLIAVCANAVSFSWSTGETTNVIEVSPNVNTTYTVTAISADNCIAQQSHTLAVHPTYRTDYSAEICQGHSYTGQGFYVPVQTEAGVFTFTNTLQTAYGCDSLRVLHLTVKSTPIINSAITGNGTINTPGNYVFMIDPVEGASSYEWILSNPNWTISYNQTVAQVSIMYPGTATLSVYALNECGQSQPVSIQITYATGIDNMETTAMQVFPNPTSGMVNVQMNMNNEQLLGGEIQLLDMYGKMLNRWEMSGDNMELDLSTYAAGVYLLKFRNTQTASESVVKVVKQ